MPRVKFRLAAGNENADVPCAFYQHEPGKAPDCSALTHPWCLAPGSGGPEACKFRKEKEERRNELL